MREGAGLDDHARAARRAATMAVTVASSAAGLGRLVMMVGASAASVFASGAISTPARAMARRRAGIDVVADHPPAGGDQVLRERAAHDAEPDDTDFALRHSQLSVTRPCGGGRYTAAVAAFKFNVRIGRCVHSRLSRRRIIPYRRRSTPERHGRAGKPRNAHDDVTKRLSVLRGARRLC